MSKREDKRSIKRLEEYVEILKNKNREQAAIIGAKSRLIGTQNGLLMTLVSANNNEVGINLGFANALVETHSLEIANEVDKLLLRLVAIPKEVTFMPEEGEEDVHGPESYE